MYKAEQTSKQRSSVVSDLVLVLVSLNDGTESRRCNKSYSPQVAFGHSNEDRISFCNPRICFVYHTVKIQETYYRVKCAALLVNSYNDYSVTSRYTLRQGVLPSPALCF